MIIISISSADCKLILLARGDLANPKFSVSGPLCESAYVEQVLFDNFGSLEIVPTELYEFLLSNTKISSYFPHVKIELGTLQSSFSEPFESNFSDLSLGQKLIKAGFLNQLSLQNHLNEYQQYAHKMKFGEYLKINLVVPPALLDFFLTPANYDLERFNDMKLGTKLLSVGIINSSQLEKTLDFQSKSSLRIGACLVKLGFLSQSQLDFFLNFQFY